MGDKAVKVDKIDKAVKVDKVDKAVKAVKAVNPMTDDARKYLTLEEQRLFDKTLRRSARLIHSPARVAEIAEGLSAEDAAQLIGAMNGSRTDVEADLDLHLLGLVDFWGRVTSSGHAVAEHLRGKENE